MSAGGNNNLQLETRSPFRPSWDYVEWSLSCLGGNALNTFASLHEQVPQSHKIRINRQPLLGCDHCSEYNGEGKGPSLMKCSEIKFSGSHDCWLSLYSRRLCSDSRVEALNLITVTDHVTWCAQPLCMCYFVCTVKYSSVWKLRENSWIIGSNYLNHWGAWVWPIHTHTHLLQDQAKKHRDTKCIYTACLISIYKIQLLQWWEVHWHFRLHVQRKKIW